MDLFMVRSSFFHFFTIAKKAIYRIYVPRCGSIWKEKIVEIFPAGDAAAVQFQLCLFLGTGTIIATIKSNDVLSFFQLSMDLPPDKAKLLKNYDNEKKWDIICDQVRPRRCNFFTREFYFLFFIFVPLGNGSRERSTITLSHKT